MGTGSRVVVGVMGGDRRPSEEAQGRNCIFYFLFFFLSELSIGTFHKLCLHKTIDEHNHNLL